MTKPPVVIQLSTLRSKAKAWYAEPVVIRIKKSWLVAVILFILGVAVGMQLAHAQTLEPLPKGAIIKPSAQAGTSSSADTATTNVKERVSLFNRGGLSVSNDSFIHALDKKNNDIKLAKIARQKAVQAHRRAEKQRAAVIAAQNAAMAVIVAPVYHAPAPVTNCGSDPYMAFIYQHESGCNTGSVNSIGCRGLGQACPGSKLPCGNDWTCQNAYFRSYAISTYGSIYNAYLAWISKSWW